jgi:hypothetical protein
MRRFFTQLFLSLTALTLLSAPAFAAFDLRGSQKIDLGSKPLDTAVSTDGKWTFALTEGGIVHVLTFGGQKVQVIETGGTLDTTGSPSKGPVDAPVVIAYFSDYQ